MRIQKFFEKKLKTRYIWSGTISTDSGMCYIERCGTEIPHQTMVTEYSGYTDSVSVNSVQGFKMLCALKLGTIIVLEDEGYQQPLIIERFMRTKSGLVLIESIEK